MVDRETEYQLVKLNDAYCRCLDEDRIEEWPNFFAEDGVYAIHPRENVDNGLEGYWMYCENKKMIRDRVTTLRNTSIYNVHFDRHIASGLCVMQESDGIIYTRTNYCIIQTDAEGRSEILSAGEYRDKVVSTDGRLRFKERIVVPDTFNIQRPLAVPL